MSYGEFHSIITIKRKRNFPFLCQRFFAAAILGLFAPLAAANASATDRDSVVNFVEKSVSAFARSVGSTSFETTIAPFEFPSHCDTPVNMELSDPTRPVGRLTVTLSCEQPKFWKMRVKAEAEVTVNMVVAKSPLKRGQSIQGADLSTKAVNLAYVRYGFFTDKEKLIGKLVRRNISPGRVLTPKLVELPEWVKRDQEVIIEARRDTMVARMKGIALEDGSEGDVIRVVNSSSQKEIRATVSAPGTVTTTF